MLILYKEPRGQLLKGLKNHQYCDPISQKSASYHIPQVDLKTGLVIIEAPTVRSVAHAFEREVPLSMLDSEAETEAVARRCQFGWGLLQVTWTF